MSNILSRVSRSSLRLQLMVGIALIVVVLISLFVIESTYRQKAFFLKLNHDRSFSMSVNLANIATSHVMSNELDGLQKLVSAYRHAPGIDYAMILSPGGTVLGHTDEKYIGLKAIDSISKKLKGTLTTQVLIENNAIVDIATPIINNREIIGWARIGMSQEYIEPNLAAIRTKGYLYILSGLIIGCLFAIIVAGRLSRSLQKLVTAAEKIKAGNRALRVEPLQSFELRKVGTAFNKMLDEVSSNENLLSMILENMPVGVMIFDETGKVKSVNTAGKAIWKEIRLDDPGEYYPSKAWFADTGKPILPHEWRALRVLADGKPVFNQEIEVECINNPNKILLRSAIPLKQGSDKIIGAIAIQVDITERKNAENELRKINRDIGERAKELRCLYRMSQLANDRNKTMENILRDCVDLIPPSYQYPEITCSRIKFEEQTFESANFVETQWRQHASILSKDGVIGMVEVFYKEQVPEEAEGPFLHEERLLINSIGDILGSSAERKKAEESIIQSEANYRQLFEQSPAPMCVIDEETFKFIQVNKACITDYGYTEQEFQQMSFDDIVFQESKKDITKTVLHTSEQTHIKRSGEHFHVRLSSIPIISNGERRILVIGTDVTEKNLYEERLAKAAIKAQEEERYEIGSELHDDVGQLLMSSLIFLGGLKKKLPAEAHAQFEETKLYITKASREIRNISHRLAPTFFDALTLHDAFDHLLASFNNDQHYKISLQFDDTVKHFPINPDLQLNLFRILQEQLKNIFKHATATEITVSLSVTYENVLELKIADNGVGFDFEPGKSGIGIANMQKRARSFNGNLSIHSSPGKGCEILVQIPLAQAN
jgi:PAS domain S-box-containing protein